MTAWKKRLNLYSTAQCTHKSFSRQNAALSIFLYRRRKEKWDWNELSPNFQVASIIESHKNRSGFLVFSLYAISKHNVNWPSSDWVDLFPEKLYWWKKLSWATFAHWKCGGGSSTFWLGRRSQTSTGGAKLRAATCRATLTNINPNRNLSVAQW